MSANGSDNHQQRYWIAAVVVAAVIYVWARFSGLTDSCLWFDEIFSVHAAEHDWNTVLPFVAKDLIHPPLFYLLLKVWIGIGGEGVAWLRALPVVISIAAFVPAAALCRELGLKAAGTFAALLLFAVNGSLIKYSQEVRMYSLLLLLGTLSVWLFARYLRNGKSLAALVAVNCLLVYSHYFGWLVIAGEFTAVLLLERKRAWRYLAGTVMVGCLFLPWLIAVISASGGGGVGQNIGWMVRPGPAAIFQLLLAITEPFYFPMSNLDPANFYPVAVPVLLMVITLAAAGIASRTGIDHDTRRDRILLATLFAMPLIAAFLVSWISPYSVWGARHLVIVFLPAMLLAGIGVDLLRHRWMQAVIVVVLMIFSGAAFAIRTAKPTQRYIWCSWEPLTEQLPSQSDTGAGVEKVYALEDLIAYHLWFSIRGSSNYRVVSVKGFEGVREDTAYFLPRGFDDVPTVDAAGAFTDDRFWVAFRAPSLGPAAVGMPSISESPAVIRSFIERGFILEKLHKLDAGPESAYLVEFVRNSR